MLTRNNQNIKNTAVTLLIEIWHCYLYASSSDCDLIWKVKYLLNTRVVVHDFKIAKIWNLFNHLLYYNKIVLSFFSDVYD